MKTGSVMAGQVVGQIKEIRSVKEVLDSMYNEYLDLRERIGK